MPFSYDKRFVYFHMRSARFDNASTTDANRCAPTAATAAEESRRTETSQGEKTLEPELAVNASS